MGSMRKLGVYLGLVDNDDQYHIDDVYPETGSVEQIQPQMTPNSTTNGVVNREAGNGAYAPANSMPPAPNQPVVRQAEVRMPRKDNVMPINKNEGVINRITTIHPRSYNDAKLIGESFRNNVPVIMNLTDMGETEAKRLVDFSAGLVFGMHGTIERVTSKVFLLSPSYVEVVNDEKPNTAF